MNLRVSKDPSIQGVLEAGRNHLVISISWRGTWLSRNNKTGHWMSILVALNLRIQLRRVYCGVHVQTSSHLSGLTTQISLKSWNSSSMSNNVRWMMRRTCDRTDFRIMYNCSLSSGLYLKKIDYFRVPDSFPLYGSLGGEQSLENISHWYPAAEVIYRKLRVVVESSFFISAGYTSGRALCLLRTEVCSSSIFLLVCIVEVQNIISSW